MPCRASPETSNLLQAIAEKMAVKRKESYSIMINFLRRRISFDILRSCLMSFRGVRVGNSAVKIGDLDIGRQEMELY